MSKHDVHFSGARLGEVSKDEWRTPSELYGRLDEEFGFAMDAASDCTNALAPRHFTATALHQLQRKDSCRPIYKHPRHYMCEHVCVPLGAPQGALTPGVKWGAWGPVFCNPPFSLLSPFLTRGAAESRERATTVVFLVAARTDTKVWHRAVMECATEVRLVEGRLKFGLPLGAKLKWQCKRCKGTGRIDRTIRCGPCRGKGRILADAEASVAPFPSAVVVFRPGRRPGGPRFSSLRLAGKGV